MFRRICNPPVLIIRICNPIDNSLFADGKAWRFERITNPYSIVRRIANHAETQRKKQTKHRNRRNAEATEAAEIRYFYSEMKQNYNRIYYNQLKNINFALNADRNNMSNTRASFTLHELHFITITVVDWIDIFTRPLYKHIITDSLAYCQQNKGLRIFAWVLMSNHLHAIVDASGELSVADIVRDFKKYTSKRLLKEIQTSPNESRREWILNRLRYAGNNDKKITNYRLWQDGYHPEQIYTYEFYKQKLDYIHLNPVRQELVAKAEDYLYSSATDYAGGKGLVDVLVI